MTFLMAILRFGSAWLGSAWLGMEFEVIQYPVRYLTGLHFTSSSSTSSDSAGYFQEAGAREALLMNTKIPTLFSHKEKINVRRLMWYQDFHYFHPQVRSYTRRLVGVSSPHRIPNLDEKFPRRSVRAGLAMTVYVSLHH